MDPLINQQAETLTLAGIVRHPEAYWTINSVGLTTNDFLPGSNNRKVFKAIETVVDSKRQPDIPLLIEELTDADGSVRAYLAKLTEQAVTVPQAAEYAKTVKGLATSRRLAAAAAHIIEVAHEYRSDSNSAVGEAESAIRRVRETLPVPDHSPDPADILSRLRNAGPDRFVKLSFSPTLQWVTGGMIPTKVWVIGGFSSVGKSAVACNLIRDAVSQRRWVGLISTEMSQEQYLIRLLAILSGVPQRDIRERVFLSEDQKARVRTAEEMIVTAPLRIYDTVYSLSGIATQARLMKETTGLDVLVVDFLQNVKGSFGDEVKDAREIIIELQQMAKELDCTVVVFSQISNEMAKYEAEGGNDNYYAFKGSGAIKDAADVAIMLRRDRARRSPLLEFHVLKNRDGELKVVNTLMELSTGRIVEEQYEDDD